MSDYHAEGRRRRTEVRLGQHNKKHRGGEGGRPEVVLQGSDEWSGRKPPARVKVSVHGVDELADLLAQVGDHPAGTGQ